MNIKIIEYFIFFFKYQVFKIGVYFTYSTPQTGPITFRMFHSLIWPVPTVLDSIGLAAPNTNMNFEITTPCLTWVSWNLRHKWEGAIEIFAFLWWMTSTFPAKVWETREGVFKHSPSSSHKEVIMRQVCVPVSSVRGSSFRYFQSGLQPLTFATSSPHSWFGVTTPSTLSLFKALSMVPSLRHSWSLWASLSQNLYNMWHLSWYPLT